MHVHFKAILILKSRFSIALKSNFKPKHYPNNVQKHTFNYIHYQVFFKLVNHSKVQTQTQSTKSPKPYFQNHTHTHRISKFLLEKGKYKIPFEIVWFSDGICGRHLQIMVKTRGLGRALGRVVARGLARGGRQFTEFSVLFFFWWVTNNISTLFC